MTRVAAIDCGTNSTRLLVADVEPDGVRLLERDVRITRLGKGVDRTGQLDPAAVDRTLAVLRDYAAIVDRHGASRVRLVATSATRDAANRQVFVDGVRDLLGIEPEVITGDEEARLSFLGATRDLAGVDGTALPYLVVDIGGGSTEFVLGETDADAFRSVDVGSVRLTERHLPGDPPTRGEIAATTRDIEAALDLAAEAVPLDRARTLVGVGGTATTLGAVALRLSAYDSTRVHRSRLSRSQVRYLADRLLAATHAERAAIPTMQPGREDVIAAGALILDRIVERCGCDEVLVSENDILMGVAVGLA